MKLNRFEQLALPHLEVVYRLAMMLVHDVELATDLAQETYRRCHMAADLIAASSRDFRSWLLKILREVYSDRIASGNGQFGDTPSTYVQAFDKQDFVSESERVHAFIKTLPVQLRSVLMLWSVEELDYDSIAFVEDISRETAQRRLYLARRELGRLLLQDEERQSGTSEWRPEKQSTSQFSEAVAR